MEVKEEQREGLVDALVETVAPAVDMGVAPVAPAVCPTIREPTVVQDNLGVVAAAAVVPVMLLVSTLSQEGREVLQVSAVERVAAAEGVKLRATAAAAAAASGGLF